MERPRDSCNVVNEGTCANLNGQASLDKIQNLLEYDN